MYLDITTASYSQMQSIIMIKRGRWCLVIFRIYYLLIRLPGRDSLQFPVKYALNKCGPYGWTYCENLEAPAMQRKQELTEKMPPGESYFHWIMR